MEKKKILITREMQEELNEINRKCGFKERPIIDDYYIEVLMG